MWVRINTTYAIEANIWYIKFNLGKNRCNYWQKIDLPSKNSFAFIIRGVEPRSNGVVCNQTRLNDIGFEYSLKISLFEIKLLQSNHPNKIYDNCILRHNQIFHSFQNLHFQKDYWYCWCGISLKCPCQF